MTDEASVDLAIARLRALHEADPRLRVTAAGPRPVEAVWCETVARWVDTLAPDASAALRIAAAAQHLERWTRPRTDYPAGRAGYLRWRRDAGRAHAQRARALCLDAACPEALADAVAALLRKEQLKSNPDTACLEDAAALAFLELDLDDFAQRHGDDDVVRILARTWAKMSPAGRAAAARLPLTERAAGLLERALAPDTGDGE
ncbi:MAG TPA: DUF4202 domain-containing protein [Pseudomonadales bacterium]|nr:DUF4202 domain-containing protein [Pseudomonadales bacterium]